MVAIETKKAGQLYLSLVPLFMALALPIIVERATQKPTPNEYIITPMPFRTWAVYMHPNRHLSLPCSLTMIEFARFRTAKDKALDKRFSINMCLPAVKMLGILIAKQTLQRYKYFF